VGWGPERGQGQRMPKNTARPRPLSGVGRRKGPGALIFWGPVHPVMNSKPDRRRHRPLTRPYLLHILRHRPTTDYNTAVPYTAFALALAGFLSVGEFTYRETDWGLGESFSKWFLIKQHVGVEFVTGRTGPWKTRTPGPFPRPAPLQACGGVSFSAFPAPISA